jgi:hypothetical protein
MVDISEEARLRAEANFKKKEEGDKAWAEHLAAGAAADAHRAKLRALRLAKEAAEARPSKRVRRKRPEEQST